MTAATLFWHRLIQNFRVQVKSWRLGIDWTVLIYTVIPAVIVSVAVYRSWWTELPIWMSKLPFEGLLLIFYIFTWMGSIRLFIEEADQLFLLQKRAVYFSLRRYGLIYSLAKSTFSTMILFLIFLPYLVFTTGYDCSGVVTYLYLVRPLESDYFIIQTLFVFVRVKKVRSFLNLLCRFYSRHTTMHT